VVPVPDPEFGARPVAFVLTVEDVADQEILTRALEEVLPRFKIPVAFYPWPDEAWGRGMKVDRVSLRERALRLHSDGRS
jgi:O-succinylbenzoic acid--CoA ligase